MGSVAQMAVVALNRVPAEVATLVLAALPVVELRGAVPVALEVYDFSLLKAILLSVLGNLLPVYFLLVFFERGSVYLRARFPLADRFIGWLFVRTRLRLADHVERYGVWALALFVAVPLPMTGAWTGALAAFVFGLSRKRSFGAIALGLCGAAVLVALVTRGAAAVVGVLRSGG